MILFIIILLLFLPIPLKINMKYFDNKIFLNINFIKVFYKNFNDKTTKDNKTTKTKEKPTSKTKEKLKAQILVFVNDIKNRFSLKKLELINKKLKKLFPIHSLFLKLEFGFEDPSITALSFGGISSLKILFFKLLSIFLNIRKFNFQVIPNLKNKKVNFEFSSIFFISIAKITYMLIMVLIILYFKNEKPFKFKEAFKWKTTQ